MLLYSKAHAFPVLLLPCSHMQASEHFQEVGCDTLRVLWPALGERQGGSLG